LPPTDKRIECQLSWALQVLKRDSSKVDIATEIISNAFVDWPDQMNNMWGPASQDYFALRLGLFHDITGQEAMASALLQNIVEHPSNPSFSFASEIASAYLDMRSTHGKVKACQEVNLLQDESLFKAGPFYYVPIDSLRESWGFGAPIWVLNIDDLCDAKLALEFATQQAPVSSAENIGEWLTSIGLDPSSVQTIYELDTLTSAWLVSLPAQFVRRSDDGTTLERQADEQFWLFVKSSQGFSAQHLDHLGWDVSTILSVDHLQLVEGDVLVLIRTGDNDFQDIFVLRIALNGRIQPLLSNYVAAAYMNHETQEITLVYDHFDADQPEIIVYRWNPELQQLDEQKINFDFAKAQAQAERLVFQERDFLHANIYINEFLVQTPPEPKEAISCYLKDCTYYPDWYRPYMRYLLALAYEMSGQTEQARDTYFALWQDYPTEVFGLAAAHRLAPEVP